VLLDGLQINSVHITTTINCHLFHTSVS
jgi:hypothetical protein